ncbi:MAG: hypothetical protein WC217_00940, partial [Candidatus Paceibacterota bacterium]
VDNAYNGLMSRIMSLFAWLVGVAAITLDNAVYYTVVTMGNYGQNLSAVGITWRILRDMGNIMLIFGFLAAGISTILNVSWYGFTTKMLPMLLVSAVFLNFSLFITEAVIDTGNLFATQFYTQINGGKPAGAKAFDPGSLSTSNEGISNKIMGQLGLQTIYGDAITNKEIFKGANSWFIGFMGILLFLVTAFVMFSLAFILIARFVVLLFLIILAPVGFAGLSIPKLAGAAGKWWSALFEQAITAPVLLLLLYIALAVITDAQFLTGFGASTTSGGASTGFVNNANLPGFASFILSFLVAMGLLLAVVIVAKKISAFGAGWATKSAGALTFGATAFGLRSTAGWGFQGASQAIRRSRLGGTKFGRVAATTFDKGAKGSFDVRGATAFGGLKGLGIEAGDAQKGGYRARREAAIKGHQEYVKTVGAAIDERGASKAEEAAIARAEETQANVLRSHEAAKQHLDPKIEQHKAEIERLEKEEKERFIRGVQSTPEQQKELDIARSSLKTNEDVLKALNENHKQDLEQAAKDLAAAKKVSGDRISGEKRGAQLAYAKNINGSFPGWVMYGPGGGAAARKIKEDATKDPNKEFLKKMRKALEQEEHPAPPGGAATPATVAPGATPPASAPTGNHP